MAFAASNSSMVPPVGIACIARMTADEKPPPYPVTQMQLPPPHLTPFAEDKHVSSISLSRKGLPEVTRRISFVTFSTQPHQLLLT